SGGYVCVSLSSSMIARQVFRGEADVHAALADGRGDHLRRPGADVAGGEDAGPTRLEQEGLPAELLPGVAILWAARQLRTRQDEAVLVDGDLAREPCGARFGSDQHDHGTP